MPSSLGSGQGARAAPAQLRVSLRTGWPQPSKTPKAEARAHDASIGRGGSKGVAEDSAPAGSQTDEFAEVAVSAAPAVVAAPSQAPAAIEPEASDASAPALSSELSLIHISEPTRRS
eukprot:5004702-Prymnesium_polylepis.2